MKYTIRKLGYTAWGQANRLEIAISERRFADQQAGHGHVIINNLTGEIVQPCDSCASVGEYSEAVTRSENPDYAGYALCEECAKEYNSRSGVV